MQAFDTSGRYGDTSVIQALQSNTGSRTVDFRYDLLDANNAKKADLVGVIAGSGSVSQDSTADVKRTLSVSIREGYDQINYLSDRIKPWWRLQMPDGGWVEWPQGVFLLSSPARQLATDGSVIRVITGYDQLVILSADAVTDRYSIPQGTPFAAAISTLVSSAGILGVNITPSNLTLPVTWDYEAGTSKLTILNDLLSAMNYRSAWFDENGTLICQPYVLPEYRSPGYAYVTDSTSTFMGEIDQDLDLFSIPNKFVLVVSDTDQGSFSATFVNIDPNSPTSTVSRGRTIVSFDDGQSAADQATLNALVRKTAYEASQVYESVPFTTIGMPFHSNADILALTVPDLGITGVKYEEISWTLPLQAGGSMSHTVQRVVTTAGGG